MRVQLKEHLCPGIQRILCRIIAAHFKKYNKVTIQLVLAVTQFPPQLGRQ